MLGIGIGIVGAQLPITVKTVKEEQHFISFLWSASGGETSVEIKLDSLDGTKTSVRVREDGIFILTFPM